MSCTNCLKPYARFLKDGSIVAGSLSLLRDKPTTGIWKEIQAVEYFNKSSQNYLNLVQSIYPDAKLSEYIAIKLELFLLSLGAPSSNIVLNSITCSDDVNATEFASIVNIGQSPPALNTFLGPFMGGGLAGYPHTGLLGLQAFQSHATADNPNNGPLLIVNMPHIGITQQDDLVTSNNNVGRILRRGKSSATSDNTCGAVVTAANWVMTNGIGGAAPTRGAGVFANNDQYYTLASILYTNRATLCSTPYNFVLDATKYSDGVKLATEYIRVASYTYLHDTLLPTNFALQNNLYLFSGTFINVDDGWSSCINVNSLQVLNGGAWTDLTTQFISTL